MSKQQLTTQETGHFLTQLLRQPQGVVPPVCLWGKHGIGKTELIRSLATTWNWPIRIIHPAQFEEMGDLLGLPYRAEEDQREVSRFAAPDWVPQEAGPGILLIDDFNRADDRIIRGLMALLQDRELVSWSLPADWHILLTANPESGSYAVTPIDEAIRSRMLHLHLKFEVDSWVSWAQVANLPASGIEFVQQYPHLIDGHDTTARTFTYFLQLWQNAGLPTANDPFFQQLTHSALSPVTAEALVRFLGESQLLLPQPSELLAGNGLKEFTGQLTALLALDIPQVGRISLFCNRLLLHLRAKQDHWNAEQLPHLKALLLVDELPAEHRLILLRGLSQMQHPALLELLRERALANLLT